jgi:hypothetical protein
LGGENESLLLNFKSFSIFYVKGEGEDVSIRIEREEEKFEQLSKGIKHEDSWRSLLGCLWDDKLISGSLGQME